MKEVLEPFVPDFTTAEAREALLEWIVPQVSFITITRGQSEVPSDRTGVRLYPKGGDNVPYFFGYGSTYAEALLEAAIAYVRSNTATGRLPVL